MLLINIKKGFLSFLRLCFLASAVYIAAGCGFASIAHAAGSPDLMVKTASENDALYLAANRTEATATEQTKSQGAPAGSAAEYLVRLVNRGGGDSFLLTGTANGSGFTVRYLDANGNDHYAEMTGGGWATPQLNNGDTLSLRVVVTPSAAPQTPYFVARVHASAALDATAVDEIKTETCNSGTIAAVTVSAPGDLSAPPESVAYYPYTITNAGNTENTFTLAASNAAGWPTAIIADDAPADGVHQAAETRSVSSTGALPPGGAYRCFVAVSVPRGAASGAYSETALTVSGSGASATDRTVTAALAPTVTMAETLRNVTHGGVFTAGVEALPGDTVEYRLAVTNSGASSATALAVSSAVPENTRLIPGSLKISRAADSEAAGCAEQSCGAAAESSGTISAFLGEGGGAASGGTLAPGSTLYLYFRVTVL